MTVNDTSFVLVFIWEFFCLTMDELQPRITDFKRLCRLCLHEKGVLMDIFDPSKDSQNLNIYQKIKACATIDLCEDDGLPSRICAPCLSSLNAAFEFRIQCENADKTLHEIYHLLVSDQVMCKRMKEKKIILVENDIEVPLVEENKEVKAKQFDGFIQVSVIKSQDDEVLEVEDNSYKNNNNCDCDEKKENTVMENAVYVINSFPNSKEPSNFGTVDEAMNVCEDVLLSDSFNPVTFHNKETKNSNESCRLTQDISEKKEELNVICLEVERKKTKAIPEAKRSACPFCHKMLTRVNEHIRLLHRNKVYVCKKKDCCAEFLTLKNLQSHQLKCFNMEKPYKCLRCCKEFYRKCNYKAHIVRHSNKKAFQCQLCDKAFVDSTGLRRHFLKHHEPQQETFTSGCCGKKFKTKEGLKRHIQKGICGVRIFPISINRIIKN